MISEVIEILKWDAFWLVRNRNDFITTISLLENFKVGLLDHNVDESKVLMIQSKEIITPSEEESEKFYQHTNQNSELCRYLHLLKISIVCLKDLIAADRDIPNQ